MIKQVSLAGGRICYELLSGSGPWTGWVSFEIKGRETLADAGWITEELPLIETEGGHGHERLDALSAAQELLSLGPDATQEDINSAFRKASVKVHPDRCPDDPTAAARFQELTDARDLLLGRLPQEPASGVRDGLVPVALSGSLPAAEVSGQVWLVVDSHDPSGLIVREGRSLSSREFDERLGVGAMVEELQRDGDRVRYRRLDGNGPDGGWVSIRSKDKELLRAPGLTLDVYKANMYRLQGHDPKLAVLSLDQALRLLDDTLAAFSQKEFQATIWQKWADSGYDPDKFGPARFPFVAGVQGPIIAKYGFENSGKGILDSIVAFWAGDVPLNAYPEVGFKNDMMHYLTDPAKQLIVPLGREDFAIEFCRKLSKVRMDGHYDLVYPGSKPWDARHMMAETWAAVVENSDSTAAGQVAQ